MINNVGLYQSTLNTHSQVTTAKHSEVSVIRDDHSTNTDATDGINKSNGTNLYLSSKSQKINELSNEFFSNKELNFVDIEKLKERAYQFGLISKSEYSALSKSEVSTDSNTSANAAVSTLTNETSIITLSSFINNFLERLNDITSNSEEDNAANTKNNNSDSEESIESKVQSTLLALSTSLQTAKNILTDVDKAKTKESFKTNLNESLSFIKETINTDAFDKMQLDDKVGLSKVYQALEIVSNITPQRLSNKKINQYIDLNY